MTGTTIPISAIAREGKVIPNAMVTKGVVNRNALRTVMAVKEKTTTRCANSLSVKRMG